ncbi:MAG: hypothetical protein NTV80_24145 [Verrucomicrobia bacterium]|nr:hypothetical protein [Verrucomicrobiota bacterium]
MPANGSTSHTTTEDALSELMYDYARWSTDRATSYLERTEGKVSALAGLIGVMLTLLLTLAPTVFPGLVFSSGLRLFAQLAFLTSLGALLTALSFSLVSLLTKDTIECTTQALINKHLETPTEAASVTTKKQQLSLTLAQVEMSFYVAGKDKSKSVKWVYRSLFIFVFTSVLAGAFAVAHMIEKSHATDPTQHTSK